MPSNWTSSTIDDGETAGQADAADHRAMVKAGPVAYRTRYTDQPVRPNSIFVAHLMAIDQHSRQPGEWPQAAPQQASAAYRSVIGRDFAAAGGRMRRDS
ncbi:MULTISPECIES: hypothetical protein [Rhodopseudomonas]|nr:MULTISPECIES: hypothetical protein [Rhodopseudomonas]WOK16587.1 hypothetical protein RBJ75_20900 [Rhodopseudomonas sp. BAL398]